jgi:hypothetical protein
VEVVEVVEEPGERVLSEVREQMVLLEVPVVPVVPVVQLLVVQLVRVMVVPVVPEPFGLTL